MGKYVKWGYLIIFISVFMVRGYNYLFIYVYIENMYNFDVW